MQIVAWSKRKLVSEMLPTIMAVRVQNGCNKFIVKKFHWLLQILHNTLFVDQT